MCASLYIQSVGYGMEDRAIGAGFQAETTNFSLLLGECDKEENLKVTGAAATSSFLKRKL